MATGTVKFFEEAMATMINGGWEAADDIKVAICDNTTVPAVGTATPALGDFTQVGSAGTYVAGGTSIGTLSAVVTEAAGTVLFDSTTNPTWAQDASNDVDAYWAIIYNDTDAGNAALAFVELGGPRDMTAGSLTITWHVTSGFATMVQA